MLTGVKPSVFSGLLRFFPIYTFPVAVYLILLLHHVLFLVAVQHGRGCSFGAARMWFREIILWPFARSPLEVNG